MYFSKYLPEFGVEPFVVTVDPEFASYKFFDKSFEQKTKGIRVYKTRSSEPFNLYSKFIGKSKSDAIPQGFTGESNPGILQKIGRFVRGNFFIPDARIGWKKFALKQAEKIIREEGINVVVTTGPPHSSHLVGRELKIKFGMKWIADFRDPWTELFYNKLFYRTYPANWMDRKLEKQILKDTDMILTIGPSMARLLSDKLKVAGVNAKKVHFIYNGYDQEVFMNLSRTKSNSEFTICHLGILSDNQPVDGFVEAMKIFFSSNLNLNQSVRLVLIGKISPGILEKIRSEIPQLLIELKDYMSHPEAMQQIKNADLLFNSLADVPDGKYLISGKLMEYIATGNPILCLGEEVGDAASLLNQFNDSKVLFRNNVTGIYNHIQSIYNKWKVGELKSLPGGNEEYSRFNTTKQLSVLINELI
jgi:glycosyltransferase involved in cell wall biosynthesis